MPRLLPRVARPGANDTPEQEAALAAYVPTSADAKAYMNDCLSGTYNADPELSRQEDFRAYLTERLRRERGLPPPPDEGVVMTQLVTPHHP